MPGARSSMKVLLVEDDAGLREGMAELISELVEVREASSVAQAQRALGEELFALVLTDLRIGDTGSGGRVILEAARKRLLPVAIVSASATEEVLKMLAPHVPDAVLTKPFQLEDMLALVERFVALRREVARRAAGPVPAESAWTEAATPGVRLAQGADGGEWLRLAPGAAHAPCARDPRLGMMLLEGSLEVEGESRGREQYLFLSAGPREVRTQEGCLAVSLPLRA
ncbi:response regulator [Archangium primigenium]|uniref:response regulator n=1 Tax=[Archangium] primigenium TaxID=2792470 RepID=UPI001EF980BA|nr:response regulator [Archangium primigenium]